MGQAVLLSVLAVLAFSTQRSTACSIMTVPNCNPTISPRVAGCQAPAVVLAEVTQGVPRVFEFMPSTVGVRVTEVLKGACEGWPAPPFETTISGFYPCCICRTEPPLEGSEMIFFVEEVESISPNATTVPAFELALDWLGSGYRRGAEADAVMQGVADGQEGIDCEEVYCLENPFCVDELDGRDCPSITGVNATDGPESYPRMLGR